MQNQQNSPNNTEYSQHSETVTTEDPGTTSTAEFQYTDPAHLDRPDQAMTPPESTTSTTEFQYADPAHPEESDAMEHPGTEPAALPVPVERQHGITTTSTTEFEYTEPAHPERPDPPMVNPEATTTTTETTAVVAVPSETPATHKELAQTGGVENLVMMGLALGGIGAIIKQRSNKLRHKNAK